MHESSSGPCEETSRRNATPLPAPIASPPIVPSSNPLKNSAKTVSDAEGDPARERDQRDLDVVGHHLGRERRGLGGVEVAALRGRIGGGLELGRDEPSRGARVDRAPEPAGDRRHQQQRPAASTSTGRSASRCQ